MHLQPWIIIGLYGFPFLSSFPGPLYWDVVVGLHLPVIVQPPTQTPTSISYKTIKTVDQCIVNHQGIPI